MFKISGKSISFIVMVLELLLFIGNNIKENLDGDTYNMQISLEKIFNYFISYLKGEDDGI